MKLFTKLFPIKAPKTFGYVTVPMDVTWFTDEENQIQVSAKITFDGPLSLRAIQDTSFWLMMRLPIFPKTPIVEEI